jgi:hypothetical protein
MPVLRLPARVNIGELSLEFAISPPVPDPELQPSEEEEPCPVEHEGRDQGGDSYFRFVFH